MKPEHTMTGEADVRTELLELAGWMNAIDACTGDPACTAAVHFDDCQGQRDEP